MMLPALEVVRFENEDVIAASLRTSALYIVDSKVAGGIQLYSYGSNFAQTSYTSASKWAIDHNNLSGANNERVYVSTGSGPDKLLGTVIKYNTQYTGGDLKNWDGTYTYTGINEKGGYLFTRQ